MPSSDYTKFGALDRSVTNETFNLAQTRVDIFNHIAAVLSHNHLIIGSKECSCAELSNGMSSYYSTPS